MNEVWGCAEIFSENHDIKMSLSTLKRRIESYSLKRKRPDYNIDDVRASVQSIIDGHGCLFGFIIKFGYNAHCHWLKERALCECSMRV